MRVAKIKRNIHICIQKERVKERERERERERE